MIDFGKPLRLIASKRQVFVTGLFRGKPMIDTLDTQRCTGFAFNYDGFAVDDSCPWRLGIENYDPAAELFTSFEDVMTPALKAQQRKVASENANNPLWGMF